MRSTVLTLRTVKKGPDGSLTVESSVGAPRAMERSTNGSHPQLLRRSTALIGGSGFEEQEHMNNVNIPLQLVASFHDARIDQNLVSVDLSQIPGAREGDVAELQSLDSVKKRRLYFIIKKMSDDLQRRSKLAQVSVQSGPLQNELNISSRTPVIVTVREKLEVEADLVEINIRDIALTRGDIWELSSFLKDTCVYRSQKLTFLESIRCTISAIYRRGKKVFSSFVGENTKIVFRSESARLIFLIQITEEMYHFEEDGEIMFHKVINSLFPKIFKKWRHQSTHHLVTIVFAANIDCADQSWVELKDGERPRDSQDYYRVVVDQVNIVHWNEIMISLRYEFANFRKDILEHHRNKEEYKGKTVRFLPTIKSDVLNTINLTTTLIFDRLRDPDLRHTTTHFIIISAGNGLYDVEYDDLIETGEKLMYSEISVDIICLSQPPLHVTPLFRYRDTHGTLHHCIPGWIDISFWNDKRSINGTRWFPKCKIYELQMMGIMENEMSDVTLEYLKPDAKSDSILEFMNNYDKLMFTPINSLSYNNSGEKLITGTKKPGNKRSFIWSIPNSPVSKSEPQLNAEPIFSSTQSKSALSSLQQFKKSSGSSTPSKSRPLEFPNDQSSFSSSKSTSSTQHSISQQIPKSQPIRKLQFPESYKKRPKSSSLKFPNSPTSITVSKSQTHTALDTLKSTMWTEIDNPSKKITSGEVTELSVGKWQDVFPKNVKRRIIKWRSLSSPSSLPITTPLFPSIEDFENNFTFQTHTISLSSDHEKFMNIADLMRDMIHLRLMLGFQICYGKLVEKVEMKRQSEGNASLLIRYLNFKDYLGSRIYLSLSEEIHRISCDYEGIINVQIYHRSETARPSENLKDVFIKTRYQNDYHVFDPDPYVIRPHLYNWNQYDQILAGYDDVVIEDNRTVNRIKFVLLPSEIPVNTFFGNNQEQLTIEEIRVEGLRKLISTLYRGKFDPNSIGIRKSKRDEILPEITFYTGDLMTFLKEYYNNNDLSNQNYLNEKLSRKDVTLLSISEELQSSKGIKLIDRKWHWKVHPNCFLGFELVSWLLENFEDLNTREEAVEYGNQLMNQGLFVHVENRHKFLDGHYFYQISPDYISRKADAKETNKDSSEDQQSTTNSIGSKNSKLSSLTPLIQPQTSNEDGLSLRKFISSLSEQNQSPNPDFVLSQSLKYDLDPNGNSYKKEIITVHYDTIHNPNHCFHIRLEWLTTTAKLIDDTINSWSRMCERYGLRLVETPWNELCDIPRLNPFHSFVDIKLAINPWTPNNEFYDSEFLSKNKFYYHIYLLEYSGFLLDNRASLFFKNNEQDFNISYSWGKPKFKYAQYIHKTGAYIAEIRDTGDLFLAPNNTHVSRVNVGNVSLQNQQPFNNILDSQKIMLEFRSTCLDFSNLRKIFLEAKENITKKRDCFTG